MSISTNDQVWRPDQSGYKCVHELDCPNLDDIKKEILHWVETNTDFLNDRTGVGFWHVVDTKNIALAAPALMQFMKSVRIPIRQISIGVLTEAQSKDGFILHHGAPPLNFKINFPIHNTEDVYTEWFDIPLEDLEALGTVKNPHAEGALYNLSKIHDTVQDLYPCLLRYNMHNHPIIFNSLIPHRVMPGPNAKYPRIMVATMPFNDPVELMRK